VLESTNAGTPVHITGNPSVDAGVALTEWCRLLEGLPKSPLTNWSAFRPFTALEMARQQCELFSNIVDRNRNPRRRVVDD
jgi:hypothetical protein